MGNSEELGRTIFQSIFGYSTYQAAEYYVLIISKLFFNLFEPIRIGNK